MSEVRNVTGEGMLDRATLTRDMIGKLDRLPKYLHFIPRGVVEQAALHVQCNATRAIQFALEEIDDMTGRTYFLEAWRDGSWRENWPEFAAWARRQ